MVRIPKFTLKYLGTDITADVMPDVLSITFNDNLETKSDDLEIALQNVNLKWMDKWLPKEGDLIELSLGYEGEAQLGPVSFQVDQPEFSGPPDRLQLKALATPITSSLRQKQTKAYENTTLKAIAQQIAQKHNLELVGNLPNVKLERVTQKEESDLAFLLRLSQEYGLVFKIEGASRLVFFRIEELEKADAAFTIARSDLKSYRLTRGAKGTYKSCKISYNDPKTGKVIEATIDATGNELPKPKAGEQSQAVGDVLTLRDRVENIEQARERAKEGLRRENSSRIELDASTEGNVAIAAGVNFTLQGFRQFDGKFNIEEAKHTLTKSGGYRTDFKARKINED